MPIEPCTASRRDVSTSAAPRKKRKGKRERVYLKRNKHLHRLGEWDRELLQHYLYVDMQEDEEPRDPESTGLRLVGMSRPQIKARPQSMDDRQGKHRPTCHLEFPLRTRGNDDSTL